MYQYNGLIKAMYGIKLGKYCVKIKYKGLKVNKALDQHYVQAKNKTC